MMCYFEKSDVSYNKRIVGDRGQRRMEHPSDHNRLLSACQTEVQNIVILGCKIFKIPLNWDAKYSKYCQIEVQNI